MTHLQTKHIHHQSRLSRSIMLWVVIALLPALVVKALFFGWAVLGNTLLVILFGYFLEWGYVRWVKGYWLSVQALGRDTSTLVTVLILMLCLPPNATGWLVFAGVFFALIVTKQLFGGLGQNIFNPAMAAYVFLLVSFPQQMTQWQMPQAQPTISVQWQFDATTTATPLDRVGTVQRQGAGIDKNAIIGQLSDIEMAYWWINAALLIGGIFLLVLRIIPWHGPVAFLGTMAFLAWFFHGIDTQAYPDWNFVLMSGGVMLAAWFVLTDPVTTPAAPLAKVIFACGVALMAYSIRHWGSYPEGIAFAVLFMNMLVPLMDTWIRPKRYGA